MDVMMKVVVIVVVIMIMMICLTIASSSWRNDFFFVAVKLRRIFLSTNKLIKLFSEAIVLSLRLSSSGLIYEQGTS